jgi:hypothetical protein
VTLRALGGVVIARLYVQRRVLLYACAAAFVVGILQPNGAVGPVVFCSLLGIAMALSQSPGRHPHLDRCEQGAPLFGRELARAKGLVPYLGASLAALCYASAQMIRGSHDAPFDLIIVLAAVAASTSTALCASIRRGWPRVLYILLAFSAGTMTYALAVTARALLAGFAFAALASFLALRQYGEALARYDPVEDL